MGTTYQKPLFADLAALEQLDDASLWAIAKGRQPTSEITRYDRLLDRNREGVLTDAEQLELTTLRTQADRFMQRIRPSCCFTTLFVAIKSLLMRNLCVCLHPSCSENPN